MKSIFPRTARLGAVLILTVGATPSEAALVSYLSGAATQTSSPVVYNLDPDWDPALGPQPGGFDRHFFQGLNAFSNQAFGSEVATSSASLQTGAVRARTTFSGGTGSPGGTTLASAFIGDTFSHSVGAAPYVWNPDQSVTFNLHIDGFQSADVAGENYFDFSKMVLMIYRPGTMEDIVWYCDNGIAGSQQAPGSVLGRYMWSIGANNEGADSCGNP